MDCNSGDRRPRFDALRQVADSVVAGAIEELVANAPDDALVRLDVLRFARDHGLSEEQVIDTFVHAAKLGLFDMSWNLLCPGCGGVLDAGANLKQMRDSYDCSLCASAYEPTLDEMVEVSFTVNPSIRRIAAHEPDSLPLFDYYRSMYFSNRLVLPKGNGYAAMWDRFTFESEEVPPGEKVILSVHLPAKFMILFEPITHTTVFLEVNGEPVRERRDLTVVYTGSGVSTTKYEFAPGPLRLPLVNGTNQRILPALFLGEEEFHDQLTTLQPILTAKRLFTNQTFRDLYRTDTVNIDQRLKIASLTVLFTDLKASTELYDRVGDLVAWDLVRAHFRVLTEVVRAEAGAVVKTIGDAVMATFPSSERGVAAAFRMRDAMDELNEQRRHEDLIVKIGMHEGPCLAVISNERLDYFGQTVNIAARVQGLATARSIFVTEPVVSHPAVQQFLSSSGVAPLEHRASLKGIADEMTVYEIP